MLKRWALLLGLIRRTEQESKCSKDLVLANVKVALSKQLRETNIRVVHPGGMEEQYQHPIPASYLMERYPGMQVTKPDVFKRPHDSVLSAETYLFPGNKYYLVPSSTVQKLKRRYSRKGQVKELEGSEQPILAIKDVSDVGAEVSEESVSSARDFFVYNDKWSNSLLKRTRKEKPFVPPIQKPRIWKEEEWEPSLISIQEVSP